MLAPALATGKTGGRDAELGRPNLVAAEGLQAAVARCHRLAATGDRVQAALPGPPERWGMLELLCVALPAGLARPHPAAIPAAG